MNATAARSTVASPSRTRRGAPGARPRAGALVRPPMSPAPGRTRRAAACDVTATRPAAPDWWLRAKVALVALVALGGATVAVAEFASWSEPDPAVTYVEGDPAWAHVSHG